MKLIKKFYSSPTIMTWLSFISKSLGYVLLLPLILTKLDSSEIALWFLFVTIITLQQLADLGFSQTFARFVSYAFGGAEIDELEDQRNIDENQIREPNWKTMGKIWGTMKAIYLRLSFLVFVLLLVFGTLVLFHPISLTPNLSVSWSSWSVILAASFFILNGNKYSAFLQGLNKVALLRGWEAFFNGLSLLTSFIVLYFNGGLLGLVVINQMFRIFNIGFNRYLSSRVENSILKEFKNEKYCPEVFKAIWPSTWRSGVGIFSAQGPIQFSGLIFAQMGNSAEVASFLFSLRILRMVSSFSQAPFYSKIPYLTILRVQGREKEQIKTARQGMQFSYLVFVFGWAGVAFFITPILKFVESNIAFVDMKLWVLLGFGMFLERFGAMHLHLYSTTNHIVWHIANGVTGILFISFVLIFLSHFAIYSFPMAMILSYALFYCWYTAKKSYSIINMNFWTFEKNTSLLSFSIFLLFTITLLVK